MAAGESLLHYIVTSQNSSTIQEYLKKQCVRFGSDFDLKFNQKPDSNTGIFLAYIRTILLPYVDTFRDLAVIAREIAVLLMAHCSADVSDDVGVITLAPHTTQVFHVLDFTLFRVFNRRPRYELPFDDDNATVNFIVKVSHDLTQMIVPINVWRAFRALGLEFYMRSEPYRLLHLVLQREVCRVNVLFDSPIIQCNSQRGFKHA
jgi:hypothetical protein